MRVPLSSVINIYLIWANLGLTGAVNILCACKMWTDMYMYVAFSSVWKFPYLLYKSKPATKYKTVIHRAIMALTYKSLFGWNHWTAVCLPKIQELKVFTTYYMYVLIVVGHLCLQSGETFCQTASFMLGYTIWCAFLYQSILCTK